MLLYSSFVFISSMSLSSMDSEAEDPFIDVPDSGGGLLLADGTTCSGPGQQTGTTVGGRRSGVSTHSLNEADLQVNLYELQ